jgi:hypothetical protein
MRKGGSVDGDREVGTGWWLERLRAAGDPVLTVQVFINWG